MSHESGHVIINSRRTTSGVTYSADFERHENETPKQLSERVERVTRRLDRMVDQTEGGDD